MPITRGGHFASRSDSDDIGTGTGVTRVLCIDGLSIPLEIFRNIRQIVKSKEERMQE